VRKIEVAKKSKKSATKKARSTSSDSNVVRIRASSAPSSKKEVASEDVTVIKADSKSSSAGQRTAKAVKAEKVKAPRAKRRVRVPRPVRASGGYFKGAWGELRQVRWPNRRATWSLTGAVIAYSAFFVFVVLLLDAGFKYMFELILGK
jgi:preprotein translocase subunit SecE